MTGLTGEEIDEEYRNLVRNNTTLLADKIYWSYFKEDDEIFCAIRSYDNKGKPYVIIVYEETMDDFQKQFEREKNKRMKRIKKEKFNVY